MELVDIFFSSSFCRIINFVITHPHDAEGKDAELELGSGASHGSLCIRCHVLTANF